MSTNKATDVLSLVIINIDTLYDQILPFFSALCFYSRKQIDFKYWAIAVKLHKLGYIYLPIGKSLFLSIAIYINSNRYSTKKGWPNVSPSNEEIEKIFTITPPFFRADNSKGKNHLERSKEITVSRGGRLGFTVHVYKNTDEIPMSPFKTYRAAQLAIGLPVNSKIVSRYIDTGKLYIGEYLFASSAITINTEEKK